MKKCLLFLFFLPTSGSIWAYDAEIDGIWYNLDSSTNTAQVTECIYYYYSGDVVIPEKVVYDGSVYSVTSIGSYAFCYCSGLTSIVIPETVRSIGESAFMYCDEVEALVCLVKNPFAICGKGEEGSTFSDYFFNAVPLYVPKGTADMYRETEGWKDFANIIEGLPTGIGEIAGDEAVNGKWSNGECYGLDGRRQDTRHRGISILRHADGSVRKVLKK